MSIIARGIVLLLFVCVPAVATPTRVEFSLGAQGAVTAEYTPAGLRLETDDFVATSKDAWLHFGTDSSNRDLKLNLEVDHGKRVVIATTYRANAAIRIVSGARLVLHRDSHGEIVLRVEPRPR